jgi:hypothetical protein
MDGIAMYSSIKGTWTPETLVYQLWFSLKNPDLLVQSSEFNKTLKSQLNQGKLLPVSDKNGWYELLLSLRKNSHQNISLEYGL